MKLKKLTIILLVVALLTGGAASFGAKRYIHTTVSDYQSKIDSRFEKIRVAVPKSDLPDGTPLSTQNVSSREVPREFLHKDAISVEQWNQFQGRESSAPLTAGAPILRSQILDEKKLGFAQLLTDGKRALTLQVDQVSSISGLLAPGDRVDILTSINRERLRETVVLMTNIQVLATGANTTVQRTSNRTAPIDAFNTVTLLVDPEQAAKLILAREEGTLSVVLRPEDDASDEWPKRTTIASLLGEPERKPELKTPTRPRVQVILGGTRSR